MICPFECPGLQLFYPTSSELCTFWVHCGHRGAAWRCRGRPAVRKKKRNGSSRETPSGDAQGHLGHSYVTNRNHQQALGVYCVNLCDTISTDLQACHISSSSWSNMSMLDHSITDIFALRVRHRSICWAIQEADPSYKLVPNSPDCRYVYQGPWLS